MSLILSKNYKALSKENSVLAQGGASPTPPTPFVGDIVGWTIPTFMTTVVGVEAVYGAADTGQNKVGSSLRSVHISAATSHTSPAGNGSIYSLNSNNWTLGGGCFYEISFSSLNGYNMILYWDQTRNSTAPASWDVQMSINGGAFNTILTAYNLPSGINWATGSRNLRCVYSVPLGAVADNQASVVIRFINNTTASAPAVSRIDNLIVTAYTPMPAPPAGSLTVTGAGTISYNGTYLEDGAYGGAMSYKLDATHYIWKWSPPGIWIMSESKGGQVDGYSTTTSTLTGAWPDGGEFGGISLPNPTVTMN